MTPPDPPDILSPDDAQRLRRHTRRAFLTAGIATAAGAGGLAWLLSRPEEDNIPAPLRKALRFNESLSRKLFDPARLIAPAAVLPADGPRINGLIGLDPPVDLAAWRLRVAGTSIALTLADLRSLPEASLSTPLNCIEGWTTAATWTGVRFRDFLEKFAPAAAAQPYVSLTTPGRTYYVGLDMPSALHPQTLLCYAINGQPLSIDHGAPLRLYIPVKYGIKSLKCIGSIAFSAAPPPDFWAEQGYDWFAGL